MLGLYLVMKSPWGGLSQALARHYSKLQLTLLDTAAVIEQLRSADFPPQIKLTAGDFLAQIPPADAYIFKGVLHDFNDNFSEHNGYWFRCF